ncbi:Uu.00g076530.m01.CDS01 [Anthostomella pinea]|uniref:Uu.00g076530.m01.CDS01 n=1 Tax=Anthostomella pinea TaxID=933095 RepID=A0AAI8VX29_9PEZI|nr:Uu.00g076530.m01.CDS01 [Anthostomella pinea]
MQGLTTAPNGEGRFQLGADGVLRTYDAGGKGLDYARLSPDLIQALVSKTRNFPELEGAVPAFAGVNGYDVPEEQLRDPLPGILAAADVRANIGIRDGSNPLMERSDCGNIICTGDSRTLESASNGLYRR